MTSRGFNGVAFSPKLLLLLAPWFAARLRAAEPTIPASANPGLRAIDSTEIALRAQLETMRFYHSGLLETVYWGLGAVFVLVGLLLGYGWFTNYRTYRRDIEMLRKQVDVQASEHRSEIARVLEESAAAIKKELGKAVSNELATKLTAISKKVASLEYARAKDSVEAEAAKATPSMKLTNLLTLLRLAMRHQPGDAPSVLKNILTTLAAGGKFTADETTRLTTLLNDLPPDCQVLRDKVLTALKEAELF